MGKYGEAAILATRYVLRSRAPCAADAWKMAVCAVFPNSPSSQVKGCPRGAYLGLCEEGLVEGIPRGQYTRSKDNKTYALRAHEILRTEPALSSDPDRLWVKVIAPSDKKHNSQMDVVASLWNQGLLLKNMK
jgi:hypothetical protein